jgi:subtilisin family serine protease
MTTLKSSGRRTSVGRRVTARISVVLAVALIASVGGMRPSDAAEAVKEPDLSASPATKAQATASVDADGNTVLGSSPAVRAQSVGDSYIVAVEDSAALQDVRTDLAAEGVPVTNTWDGALTGLTATLDDAARETIEARDDVVAVEPDRLIKLTGTQGGAPWNLDRLDQRGLPLDSTYTYIEDGSGVTAYVIDSGINSTHQEFADAGGRVKYGAYWDFGDGWGITDCIGHGTHVAGTVGGTTWGVAKLVDIVPVKVFPCSGSTQMSIVVEAMNWVINDHGAGTPAVLNLSLGGSASTVVDDAVSRLVADGITVVAAAGNDGANTCSYSPARVPAAITVAASGQYDDPAWFSNYGRCNDIFAPGVEITSASYASDTGTEVMDGTSMAAPHVTGVAALILQRNPSATPAQVWQTISAEATRGAISECCGDPDVLLAHLQRTVPSAVRSLTAVPGNRTVALKWSGPASNGGTAVTDYMIQRSASPTTGWATVSDGVGTATTYTVTGLTNGARYYFRVLAKNAMGTGAPSGVVSQIPRTVPSAPVLTATAGHGRVALKWTAPSSTGGSAVARYVVQRSTRATSGWASLSTTVPATARSYTATGLHNGTRYYFRIAAINGAGASAWRTVSAVPR